MLTFDNLMSKVKNLESRFQERDARWSAVEAVRAGRLEQVFPEHFNVEYPYPMVANVIDNVARDLSEALGPLPALNCQSGSVTDPKAREFASRRARIASSYWGQANLQMQMFRAADNYVTYGMAPFIVEPDLSSKAPKIRYVGVKGAYPEFDQDGNCVTFVRKWQAPVGELAAQFPEHAARLLVSEYGQKVAPEKRVDVYRYVDKNEYVLAVAQPRLILSHVNNKMGVCPVVVAVRPSPDSEMRGQFDDVLGVQAARAIMMRLAIEGAEKAVQAPIAVPDDISQINVGPDALIRTSQPGQVKRIDLNVDGSTFAEMGALQQELLNGSRYPGARQGALQASVITGKGVEALMGGFDSQIKTGQMSFAWALQRLTSLAFQMDELFWPDEKKTIRGTVEGTPFEETYVPARQIKGDYTCDVTYGFLSGMDPNRSLVFLLQLLGAKAIDRATLQRHMPFDVDVNQLQQNIDAEELRDSLKQGVMSWAQTLGPMAQQGQDPTEVLSVLARAIKGRQDGDPLEDLLLDGLREMQEAQQAALREQMAAAQGGEGEAGGLPPGMGPDGLLDGVAPGQAGMAPGGKPDLQMLMAKMSGSGGAPQMNSSIRRALPA